MTTHITPDEAREALKAFDGITLEESTVTYPAFDDDPDRSDVTHPTTRVHGLPGWGTIDGPPQLNRAIASLKDALETIASMTVETDIRIVPADTNGGKYETVTYKRHVTEWRPDE